MSMKLKSLAFNGENFAFNPATGQSFSINDTGKFLIEEIVKGTPHNKLKSILQKKFNLTEPQAFIDVEEFIMKLKLYQLGD